MQRRTPWQYVTDPDTGRRWPLIAGGADDDAPDAPDDDTPDDTSDDAVDWKAEAEKWKALSRKHEGQAKANADAAKKLSEIEESDKSEAQKAADKAAKAEKRAEEAELRALRLEVAADKGLTPAQARRLMGSTKEELDADADDLLASFKSDGEPANGKPKEKLKLGASGADDEPEETDPARLADAVIQRQRGY